MSLKPSAFRVLNLLRRQGARGLSPNEAHLLAGCDRLAARILELRAAGHEVMTLNERHPGGTHARYVLCERPAPTTGIQEPMTW